jgi:hypothetical protein
VIVTALDETLGFGIGGFADHHLRAQRPAEGLALFGELDLPGPPPTNRAFTIPDHRSI